MQKQNKPDNSRKPSYPSPQSSRRSPELGHPGDAAHRHGAGPSRSPASLPQSSKSPPRGGHPQRHHPTHQTVAHPHARTGHGAGPSRSPAFSPQSGRSPPHGGYPQRHHPTHQMMHHPHARTGHQTKPTEQAENLSAKQKVLVQVFSQDETQKHHHHLGHPLHQPDSTQIHGPTKDQGTPSIPEHRVRWSSGVRFLHDLSNIRDTTQTQQRHYVYEYKKTLYIAIVCLVILILSLFVGGIVAYFIIANKDEGKETIRVSHANFRKYAIVTDSQACADKARTILDKEGNIIQAAIAGMLCNDVHSILSSGFGGGFNMIYYEKSLEESQIHVVDAQCVAPLNAHLEDFAEGFSNISKGGASVLVPGLLLGYKYIFEEYPLIEEVKKLNWSDLFEDIFQMCDTGFTMGPYMSQILKEKYTEKIVLQEAEMKEFLYDYGKRMLKEEGSEVFLPQLCATLKTIAEDNSEDLDSFYKGGRIGKQFVEDVNSRGGILTMEDLARYKIRDISADSFELNDNYKMYTIHNPASGDLLGFILRFLRRYKFSSNSVKNVRNSITTYHRIIEAFKHASALRMMLGDYELDEEGEDDDVTFDTEIKWRAQNADSSVVNDKYTHNLEYYLLESWEARSFNSGGSSAIVIIDQSGSAVIITSSLNKELGAEFVSKTGIIPNNYMSAFTFPKKAGEYILPKRGNNLMAPGKRPVVPFAPAIILDKKKNVVLAIAATGKLNAVTATAQTILNILYFEMELEDAIESTRLHQQLKPNVIYYEKGFSTRILKGLQKLEHQVKRLRPNQRANVIAIRRKRDGTLTAIYDKRKEGSVDGI